MKNSKILKRLLVLLIMFGVLFLYFYAPRIIVEIKNPLVEIIKGKHEILNRFNSDDERRGKYLNFRSTDGIELSSYLTFSTEERAKGTIILLHGIRSNKEHFIKQSERLSKLGYNTVALDSRAHGASEGKYCTFGVKEKKDISILIDKLIKDERIDQNIGIWGQSLGGAIGLQAMGTDERIKFGIIESTFSDFETIANDYFFYHMKIRIRPLANFLLDRAGKIGDFNIKAAKPEKYCEKIKQPILIVHGNRDKRINIKYAKNNFAKILSKQKEFIEIENANHLNIWEVGGDEYFSKVINFIRRNTVESKVDDLYH